MYNEPLKNKSYDKLKEATLIYAERMYVKIGELQNVYGLVTKEHFRNVPEGDWTPIDKNYAWGSEEWENLWVKGTFAYDERYDGQNIYAVSHAGGIEQLFFVDGKPKGLFNIKGSTFTGPGHCVRRIGKNENGKNWDLAFECYTGHFCAGTSVYENYEYPDMEPWSYRQVYKGVDICIRDEIIHEFVFDMTQLSQAIEVAPETNFLKYRAMKTLDKVLGVLILDPKSTPYEIWHKSVEDALAITREMYKGQGNSVFGRLCLTGHSHMDTAWLWPASETMRKCARTYSNALALMEEYPEYRFIQSSALHCEWMKDYYPSIFEDMKKRVAEGRYEPNGGVYVECDCNITSGELMIRQFLKGQQFTRENFGYTSDSFWLPDTFGYNGNIPQIMRGCGCKYFYTTKMAWNELNNFPFLSFTWKGIDGSSVLTHFNRIHRAPDVDAGVNLIKEMPLKETSDLRLHAFGVGDGGGGPSYSMLEAARRIKKLDGMPEVQECSASQFMHKLEEIQEDLPVYDGELYLELHRGTLTQMHDIKRKNRKAEFALRDMEYFNVLSKKGMHEMADKWIKVLLKNQFHDILPGTSITPVYDLFNKEMDELLINYKSAALEYAKEITDKKEKAVTLYNTLSFDRSDVQTIEAEGYAEGLPSQRYTDICGKEVLAIGGVSIPAFSSKTILLSDKPAEAESPFKFDGKVLETPFAVITLGDDGFISSFIDKASGRELRKENGAPLNALLTAEDAPAYWDNWDIEYDALDKLRPITGFEGRDVVTDGAVEFIIRSTYSLGYKSKITQDMIVYADNPRVDFRTIVDWNEVHCLLKAGFDVNIKADTVKNEIQFGHVQRPTTRNNSIDVAKFEVCNYKWTDISETRFGVAILNDCKYGISAENGNLRLSLHRGGNRPETFGDAGVHEMTYSFLPHSGSFSAENVVIPAYELNVPAFAVEGNAKDEKSFLTIDESNIICESIKPTESGENGYVVRLYECEGTRAKANVTLSRPGKEIVSCNMIEDEGEKLTLDGNTLSLTFRPFEVKTFIVKE